jgi:hypothetical protein
VITPACAAPATHPSRKPCRPVDLPPTRETSSRGARLAQRPDTEIVQANRSGSVEAAVGWWRDAG